MNTGQIENDARNQGGSNAHKRCHGENMLRHSSVELNDHG
jgi:hypothetical protein